MSRTSWGAIFVLGLLGTVLTTAQPVAAQRATCFGQQATIVAKAGEITYGTSGDDVIVGTSGNDIIRARAGDDRVCSKAGNDDVKGGSGNDRIKLGPGSDYAHGGSGDDFIKGGSGDDTIQGGAGDDEIRAGKGSDRVRGGKGRDTLFGNSSRDVIKGQSGIDRCFGGTARDTLRSCNEDPTAVRVHVRNACKIETLAISPTATQTEGAARCVLKHFLGFVLDRDLASGDAIATPLRPVYWYWMIDSGFWFEPSCRSRGSYASCSFGGEGIIHFCADVFPRGVTVEDPFYCGGA